MNKSESLKWMFYPELTLDDDEWHKIVIYSGGNEDQSDLLFMRVEDSEDDVAIVGLNEDHIRRIRDHFNEWLEWKENKDNAGTD